MNTRKGQKKQAIYNAVCTLWQRERNFDALTVQRIAQEAGIGKGTVYEYFKSREELLAETVANEMRRCADAVQQAVEDAETYEEKLAVLLKVADDFLRLQTLGIQAIASYLRDGNELPPLCDSPLWTDLARREDDVLLAVLRCGAAEGKLTGIQEESRRLLALRSLLYGYVAARRRAPGCCAGELKKDMLALLRQTLG